MRVILPLVAVFLTLPAEAHKGATAKFTYNAHVYPVFLNRCSGCHVDGGVGPMSLLRYEDAFPWAEALRAELLAAGTDRSDDFVRAAHRDISARELDVILDWATGGTPEGDAALQPTPPSLKNEWTAGAPDMSVALPPHLILAEVMEDTREFVVPLPSSGRRQLRAIDVRPGNPAIVRQVSVRLRSATGDERELPTWVPRQTPALLPVERLDQVVTETHLVARIHYKKTWKSEGQPMTDQSVIGLYFVR